MWVPLWLMPEVLAFVPSWPLVPSPVARFRR